MQGCSTLKSYILVIKHLKSIFFVVGGGGGRGGPCRYTESIVYSWRRNSIGKLLNLPAKLLVKQSKPSSAYNIPIIHVLYSICIYFWALWHSMCTKALPWENRPFLRKIVRCYGKGWDLESENFSFILLSFTGCVSVNEPLNPSKLSPYIKWRYCLSNQFQRSEIGTKLS